MRILGLSLMMLLLACSTTGFDEKAWLEKGAEVIHPFKIQMKTALQASLSQGVLEGINVCRVTAPQVAGDLSTNAVRVGRTSHRLRNPVNAPAEWMKAPLARYASAQSKLPATVLQLPDGTIGYLEPIYAEPICLTCHGADLAPAVAKELDRLYPEDRARGFNVDEFRGLFWAEFTVQ